jgi:HPt (histidine-containing phosphotransfer) domain-containing protein
MSDQTGQVDRRRCLAAGIDRYTTKPRNTSELRTILLAFSDPDSIPQVKPPANWNRTEVVERAGGDDNALSDLLRIFAREHPRLMAELNDALLSAHAEILERTALKLAEDLSYLGALALARTARELALVAKRRDFLKAGTLVAGLPSQLFEVTAFMGGASL